MLRPCPPAFACLRFSASADIRAHSCTISSSHADRETTSTTEDATASFLFGCARNLDRVSMPAPSITVGVHRDDDATKTVSAASADRRRGAADHRKLLSMNLRNWTARTLQSCRTMLNNQEVARCPRGCPWLSMTEASYQCKVDLYLKRLQNSLVGMEQARPRPGRGRQRPARAGRPADRVRRGSVAAFRWFLVGVTKALSTYLPLRVRDTVISKHQHRPPTAQPRV